MSPRRRPNWVENQKDRNLEELRRLTVGRWNPPDEMDPYEASEAVRKLRAWKSPFTHSEVAPVEPYVLPPSAETWLYVVQAGGRGGPIKIGIAKNPDDRLCELQVGNHEELKLLHAVSGNRELEQRIHRDLSTSRIRGEWFNVTPAVVEAIRSVLAEPGRVSWRTCREHPHGIYWHSCRVCGTAAKINPNTRMCGACAEFAELRASGIDPFAEEAA